MSRTVCDKCGLVLQDGNKQLHSANFDSSVKHQHCNDYDKGIIYALCDNCMSRPTDAALKLAEWFFDGYGLSHNPNLDRAVVIAALAKRIDEQLLLPEKHAALLLAQQVVDDSDQWGVTMETINLLRAALARIRKSTDCPSPQKPD